MEVQFGKKVFSILKNGRVDGTSLKVYLSGDVRLEVHEGRKSAKGYIALPHDPDVLKQVADALLELASQVPEVVPEPEVPVAEPEATPEPSEELPSTTDEDEHEVNATPDGPQSTG